MTENVRGLVGKLADLLDDFDAGKLRAECVPQGVRTLLELHNAQQPAGEAVACPERIAQLTAHRACHSAEHDPANGRLHGYCVVCGVPWPCEYAGKPPTPADSAPLVEALRKARAAVDGFRFDSDVDVFRLIDAIAGIADAALAAYDASHEGRA
jgi:hypothetical protein